MEWTLINILAGAFATGFVALNVRSASDRICGVLITLALGGAAMIAFGVPMFGTPWRGFLTGAYAVTCLAVVAHVLRRAWSIEPRRVALSASEATAALAIMLAVLSFA